MPQGKNIQLFINEKRIYSPIEEVFYQEDNFEMLMKKAMEKASIYNVAIEIYYNSKQLYNNENK